RPRRGDRHRHEPLPHLGALISWADLCPRMGESARKRRCTRVRPGAPWLKVTLLQGRGERGAVMAFVYPAAAPGSRTPRRRTLTPNARAAAHTTHCPRRSD